MGTAPCYVQVDVDGEEVFWVDKEILSSFSGRINTLLSSSLSSSSSSSSPKVILHGLPGGSEAFELITRFCYTPSTGKSDIIIPANTCLLHFAAQFMDMGGGGEDTSTAAQSESPSLVKQTQIALDGRIAYWTWSELLIASKQCQSFSSSKDDDNMFDKVMDSVVTRIASTKETNPSNSSSSSSPESSGVRFSFDTRSTATTKNSSQRAWWFQDLMFLNPDVLKKMTIKMMMMVSKKPPLDHTTICRFLLYYLKNKPSSFSDEKRITMEVVIDLLYSLDRTSVSCRSLFAILRMSLSLNLTKLSSSKLERIIGSQIDRANLDNILVPAAPVGVDGNGVYDVGLVLRLCKSFLIEVVGSSSSSRSCSCRSRLKMVGSLIDLYLAEVAPDPSLKPQKFVSLAMLLPDDARDCYDGVYRALDMYITVHVDLSEEQRLRICCVLNYEKLSTETCKHLAQNSKLPSRTAIQALVSQQSKLKSLLTDTDNSSRFLHKSLKGSHSHELKRKINQGGEEAQQEQVILYAKKLDVSNMENEKLKAHLQGMQWKVLELEKICRKMQTQMTRIMKTNSSSSSNSTTNSKSLPKLCS